jgi:hypothetical protein
MLNAPTYRHEQSSHEHNNGDRLQTDPPLLGNVLVEPLQ